MSQNINKMSIAIPASEVNRILVVTATLKSMSIDPEVDDSTDPIVISFEATDDQVRQIQGDNSIKFALKGLKSAVVTLGNVVFSAFDFVTLDGSKLFISGAINTVARVGGNAVTIAAETGAVTYSATKAACKRIAKHVSECEESQEFAGDVKAGWGWLKNKLIAKGNAEIFKGVKIG